MIHRPCAAAWMNIIMSRRPFWIATRATMSSTWMGRSPRKRSGVRSKAFWTAAKRRADGLPAIEAARSLRDRGRRHAIGEIAHVWLLLLVDYYGGRSGAGGSRRSSEGYGCVRRDSSVGAGTSVRHHTSRRTG